MNAIQRRSRQRIRGLGICIAVVLALVALPERASAQTESVTIPLNELDVPGISGTAMLTDEGEATRVEMTISGSDVTGNHPTHIHTGTCENFDPNPTFPLTTVILDPVDETGVSTTVVEDVSLRELLRSDYVVVVHKSTDELTTYFVCGDINEDDFELPATGVGSRIGGSAGSLLPLWLGGSAGCLLMCALALRRRAHASAWSRPSRVAT